MNTVERWFYLSGIALLVILLLWNWKCKGRCPEITTETKTDTLYLPWQGGAGTVTIFDPTPIGIKKPKIKKAFNIDTSGILFEIDTGQIEIIDITDLLSAKIYDTTFKFVDGEVNVVTEIEANKIKRQDVTPKLLTRVITNSETKTVTNTVYESRRALFAGLNLYGTSGSWLNGIGGSLMYKTKKDLCFEGGVFKLNSLPVQYTIGTKLKIKLK